MQRLREHRVQPQRGHVHDFAAAALGRRELSVVARKGDLRAADLVQVIDEVVCDGGRCRDVGAVALQADVPERLALQAQTQTGTERISVLRCRVAAVPRDGDDGDRRLLRRAARLPEADDRALRVGGGAKVAALQPLAPGQGCKARAGIRRKECRKDGADEVRKPRRFHALIRLVHIPYRRYTMP